MNVFATTGKARGFATVMSTEEANALIDTLNEKSPIEYVKTNPKRPSGKAHARFAAYMKAKSVGEFIELGGTAGDFKYDLERGFVKVLEAAPDVPVSSQNEKKVDVSKPASNASNASKAASK